MSERRRKKKERNNQSNKPISQIILKASDGDNEQIGIYFSPLRVLLKGLLCCSLAHSAKHALPST